MNFSPELDKREKKSNWDDISLHVRRFKKFVTPYLTGQHSAMLDMKYYHSLQVAEHGKAIVQAEGLSEDIGRAALIATLYHDVGRFPQFKRWHTFRDADSDNHGFLGVTSLKETQMLTGESNLVQQHVLVAVALHNSYKLPVKLSTSLTLVTNVVRDSDKLDIMRIMANHLNTLTPSDDDVVLHVRNQPKKWTPKIAYEALQGHVPSYNDLVYINDFRILLGTWLGDLHFQSAKKKMAYSGYIEAIIAGLPKTVELRPIINQFTYMVEQAKKGE